MSTSITRKLKRLFQRMMKGEKSRENLSLNANFILNADSYKLSQFGTVWPRGIKAMTSYGEPRRKGEMMVPFGFQMHILKTLMAPITQEDIEEAAEFAEAHGEPFNREGWEYILEKYEGYIPVKIYAVPEGTRVPSQNILYRIDCEDEKVFWLSSYIETQFQRGVWYPTAIASNDLKNWRLIRRYWMETADAEVMDALLGFTLHDFGGRGVTCEEQAQIGGAAHLVFFKGSDTISGVRAANLFYDCIMAAFSVPATEHSIQCAWGPAHQKEYLEAVLATYAKPGKLVSMVLDGYDVFREARLLCSMHEMIKASGARVVFRPDSGDPLEVIPRILKMQEEAFGSTVNSKGYKVINNVGIIQGDGVNTEMIGKILELVTSLGYSAANIVFGSGGALLQKVDRDTYAFAQKASAIFINGKWKPIFKDPVTDSGKKSKSGLLTLLRSKLNGEYMTAPITDVPFSDEWEDSLPLIYDTGRLVRGESMDNIRKRAQS